MSSWKVIHGLVVSDGFTGQCGSTFASMNAAHATAMATIIWHTPSATRGRTMPPASHDPTLLPMPRPVRNTARMIEKVYTVAPSISDSRRAQITSAASAVAPEIAIVM
jgi:hypothetical protein